MSEKKSMVSKELFENIFLLKEEQPHQIPDNWRWVYFGSVAKLHNGNAYKSKEYTSEGIPLIRISDINDSITNLSKTIKVPKAFYNDRYLVKRGDLLIAMSGATTGKTGIYESDQLALQNQRVGNIKEKYEKLLNKSYKNYFIIKSKEKILDLAYGGAQPNISGNLIESLAFPLPPIKEQERIENKISILLNKINKAQQLIEEAKETFEMRRARILDEAFRGELTEEWRKANVSTNAESWLQVLKSTLGYKKLQKNKADEVLEVPYSLPKGWTWARIRDISHLKTGYAFKSKDFADKGYQLIRMGNLYKNELDLNRNPVYLPENYDEEKIKKYTVRSGDILLTLTGTKYKRDYGYAIRIEKQNKNLILNQRILSLTPYELNDYFYYYLQSNIFRDMFFNFETGGVNQGNVSSKAVESIYFPLPPLEEGKEIQKKINNILEKEKRAFNSLGMYDKLESLKKTILNKAFKGELGTNDAFEESAEELLKKVLQ